MLCFKKALLCYDSFNIIGILTITTIDTNKYVENMARTLPMMTPHMHVIFITYILKYICILCVSHINLSSDIVNVVFSQVNTLRVIPIKRYCLAIYGFEFCPCYVILLYFIGTPTYNLQAYQHKNVRFPYASISLCLEFLLIIARVRTTCLLFTCGYVVNKSG